MILWFHVVEAVYKDVLLHYAKVPLVQWIPFKAAKYTG